MATPGTSDPNDVIRATAVMQLGTAAVVNNVFYYKLAAGASQADTDIATAISGALDDMYGELTSLLSTALTFTSIDYYNVTQERPMVSQAWPSLTAGSVSTERYASPAAALVVADTGYSRSRPKKFIAGLSEANVVGDLLSGDWSTPLAAFASGWLESVLLTGGNSLLPGTWSRKYTQFRPLIAAIVSNVVAYQRRRKLGRGV